MYFLKILAWIILFNSFSLHLFSQSGWKNPIIKQKRLGSPLVETSPFVFKNKLYLLENWQQFWDVPGSNFEDKNMFSKDEVRIRDLQTGKIVSVALKNHAFGTVLIWKGKVYVFAGDYGIDKPWRSITSISMTSSSDLKNWSKPVTVLQAEGKEHIFNTAVCRGKDKFILLYETDDSRWPAFTFKYTQSSDMENWEIIPDALYGTNKYVGGPALYYEGGWYYTLYLHYMNPTFETRITRSKDLKTWEDAPLDRPFVTFDSTHKNMPLRESDLFETNASDVELCYFKGRTIIYFTGGNQNVAGDLQRAIFKGKPRQLFEYFFMDTTKKSLLTK
jgi:alpha-L-fucosidase